MAKTNFSKKQLIKDLKEALELSKFSYDSFKTKLLLPDMADFELGRTATIEQLIDYLEGKNKKVYATLEDLQESKHL
jgi:hypothetical protein